MTLNDITGEIVDAAMAVHTALGPGLLESAYRTCLAIELVKRGLKVRTEIPVSFVYEGVEIENAYRIDMLVNDCVIVETKAVSKLIGIHESAVVVAPSSRRQTSRIAPQLPRSSPTRRNPAPG